jgi:hypothetical protein
MRYAHAIARFLSCACRGTAGAAVRCSAQLHAAASSSTKSSSSRASSPPLKPKPPRPQQQQAEYTSSSKGPAAQVSDLVKSSSRSSAAVSGGMAQRPAAGAAAAAGSLLGDALQLFAGAMPKSEIGEQCVLPDLGGLRPLLVFIGVACVGLCRSDVQRTCGICCLSGEELCRISACICMSQLCMWRARRLPSHSTLFCDHAASSNAVHRAAAIAAAALLFAVPVESNTMQTRAHFWHCTWCACHLKSTSTTRMRLVTSSDTRTRCNAKYAITSTLPVTCTRTAMGVAGCSRI